MQQEEVASEPVLDNMWHFSGQTEDRKARPQRVWSTHKPGRLHPPKSGLLQRSGRRFEDGVQRSLDGGLKVGKNNLERALVPPVNTHSMNWKEERIKTKRRIKK